MSDLSFDERRKLVQTEIQKVRGSDLYIVEMYEDRVVYEVYGDSSEAGKSYEVSYTLGADQSVTFGDRQEVVRETTFRAVKSIGKDTIEGPIFLFGSRDVDGETFTADTDFCLDWFGKSGRPLLYEHGLDRALKTDVIGRQVDYETRDEGIWAQSQLEAHGRYRKAVDTLIERGALGYSGGAMGHLATKDRKSGAIKRFPWVEASLTPTPAEPGNLGLYYLKSADAIRHLEAVDVDIPDPLKAALSALDEWAISRDDDSLPDGLKFADLVDRLSVDGPAWVKARRDWYAKSGRVLSAATRERLVARPEALRQLADDLDELLSNADGEKSAGADFLALFAETAALEERVLGLHMTSKGL